jgi:hypothetical protein
VSINDGFRNEGLHAGFSPVIHVPGPVVNTRIYNNLVVRRKRAAASVDPSFITFDNWNGFADSTLLANNIFCIEEGTGIKYGKSTGTHFTHNAYYGLFTILPDDSYAITVPPGFVQQNIFTGKEPAGFKLAYTSPCIHKGMIIAAHPVRDYFGNWLQPTEVPSIGVHQVNNAKNKESKL